MKRVSFLFLLIGPLLLGQLNEKAAISQSLDAWHGAAASANFEAYFELMTEDAVFIGTDAGENWQRNAFIDYAKPHFDSGKAWSFTAVERNIYVDKESNLAWFDELLDTQMKICRGSGVLRKEDGKWKIIHYVLSLVVPNEYVNDVVQLKMNSDSLLLRELKLH